MNFGKPFPTQDTSINGLADANVRAALNYSIQKGYTDGNPQQVEQAIWFLRDNTWHNPDHPVGQEIVSNAISSTLPTGGSGTAINDAVTQNKVTVTAKFVPQTADHFYGDAQVQVKNTGTADITVYMPIGTVFTVPNGAGTFQDLAAYALNVAPAQATTTVNPAITASPVVTGTASPTGTTTVSTPAATATIQATATTAVATATSAPVATTAVEATATTAPLATPTQATVGSLPATGSGDSNFVLWALALTAISLMAIGSGVVLAYKRRP